MLHKFILGADGAHVFLILPPEFQVCQRRSAAAKVFFCQEQNEPELFGRSRIGLFLSASVSYLPPSPFPSDQAETATFSAPMGNGEFSLRPPENIFLSKSAFDRHKTANTARNVLSKIENAYKVSGGPLLECLC